MTPEKAEREFRWVLAMVKASEEELVDDESLLGDTCKELRLSNGLIPQTIAERMGVNVARVAELEASCSRSMAHEYWGAVLNFAPQMRSNA